MKILVVEDEPKLLDVIVKSLKKEHFLVETADNFETAAVKIGVYEYDIILLDITLPGGSGLNLLSKLKEQKKTDGVLIISAKDSLDDRIKGLNLGADDYLPKPFHMAELHARINSILRRRKFDGDNKIEYKNILIEPEKRLIYINGENVNLHRKEFDILLYLIINKNKLITKAALGEYVWGDQIDSVDDFEFIYSQMKNLRKKLRDNKAEIEIQSVYGMGYKLISA